MVSQETIAQNINFGVLVKFNINEGDFEHSKITITKDGQPFRVIHPKKFKTDVDLPFGSKYVFDFEKLNYITKSVIIDTHIPDGRIKEPFAKFSMEVRIQAQPVDKIVTYTQPVWLIKYSKEIADFDFDKDYSLNVEEMQKKAEENAKPAPKPPTPRPQTESPPPPKAELPPSNPIPVVVKEPEYNSTPPPKKAPEKRVVTPQKPLVKNKTERVIQEDRRKITIITLNINDIEYIYKKEEYSWGGIYFYKNNNRITELTYLHETQ